MRNKNRANLVQAPSSVSPCRTMRRRFSALAAILTFACSATVYATSYTVVDIGTLGGQASFARGINNSGEVVGFISRDGSDSNTEGFVYSGGTTTAIASLPGYDNNAASAINDAGQIVGSDTHTSGPGVAAFLQTGSTLTNLGTLGGNYAVASGINSSGEVVGGSSTIASEAQVDAFSYSAGTRKDLGTPPNGYSYAYGVNDSGDVVGSEEDDSANTTAFLYVPSTGMTSLGTLSTDPLGYNYSQASAINNAGMIVGGSSTDSGDDNAFLYSSGVMQDLGNLGGGESYAASINNLGQIVGYSINSNYDAVGFVYDNGQMLDLNTLLAPGSGWTINDADGINDSGEIAVSGTNASGQHDALLLIPIAVPAPSAMFGGLALLGALGFRRIVQGQGNPNIS